VRLDLLIPGADQLAAVTYLSESVEYDNADREILHGAFADLWLVARDDAGRLTVIGSADDACCCATPTDWIAISRSPLAFTMHFPAVMDDGQGACWGLTLNGVFSVQDPETFCKRLGANMLPRGQMCSQDMLLGLARSEAEPLIVDQCRRHSLPDLIEHRALSIKWWRKHLSDWLGAFGIEWTLSESPRWIAVSGNAADLLQRQCPESELEIRLQRDQRATEVEIEQIEANVEEERKRIAHDQALSDKQRANELEILEIRHQTEMQELRAELFALARRRMLDGIASPAVGDASDPGAGAGSTPVVIEHLIRGKYKQGVRRILKLRAASTGAVEQCEVTARVQSRMLASEIELHASLGPDEVRNWEGIPFIPSFKGDGEVFVTVSATNSYGLPLGRWKTEWIIDVEDGQDNNDTPPDPFAGVGMWRPLQLSPDRAFERRLALAAPSANVSPPPLPPELQLCDDASGRQVSVSLRTAQGRELDFAIVFGPRAVIGRGGDPEITWWIRPEPFNRYQSGRISRKHAILTLDRNHAWICDQSTNGITVNNDSPKSNARTVLADKDRMSLAQAVDFRVSLMSTSEKVFAAVLERQDALKRQLAYILTDNTAAACIPESMAGQTLWLAMVRDSDGRRILAACSCTDGVWRGLTSDPTELPGGGQLSCRTLNTPEDQDSLTRRA